MAGSIHGADSAVPKRPTGRYANTKMIRPHCASDHPADRLDRIKDEMIAQFNARTKGLNNNECIILARELAAAFGVTAEFCGSVN